MKPKHILVVSQYFYPEDFRINDMCVEWVKRGYQVTVVTGIPNYPEGKFYKGYGWCCKRRENWNGVEIIRLPLIPRGKSSVGMVMNYLSFVVSGFFWKTFTRLKADLVFTFEVSPMTQALVGVGYSRRRKVPHYLYVQDLWPENVESITGITSPMVIKPISKMVNYIYKYCHKIFATSPSFVKAIQPRTPGQEEKVLYWPQYAEDFYMPQPRRPLPEIPEDDTFKIIFTGNIGQAQGLEILPRTAQQLKKLGVRDVRFVIVGDGRHKGKLLEDIRNRDVGDMFMLINRQPSSRIPELLAACDMAYLSFNHDPIFAKTIPAKLQTYMACGAPILATATGESRRIIRAARCGVCCEIGSVDSLVKVIRNRKRLNLPAMSKNARAYFEKNFRRDVLMDEMDRHFSDAGNSVNL